MKKLLSACMAIVLSFGLLSGCGNTASSATSGAASGGGSDLGTPQTFKFGLTVASTHPLCYRLPELCRAGGREKRRQHEGGALLRQLLG